MGSANVLEITDGNFEQEVLGGGVVLLDFWAEWCMPCRMLAPAIDEIADDYAGTIKVGKVDAETNRNLFLKFGIESIPTLLIFKDGAMVKKFMGLQQKADIKAAIDSVLEE